MSKARDLANAGTALGAVTATELGYVDGVTSAIQTQVDGKEATLPSQTGNSGKYLTTNGTAKSWGTVSQYALPTQTGNSGKYLTTNGTAESWGTVNTGYTWTQRLAGDGTSFLDIAYNGTDLYVAVGGTGKLYSSPDGVTWTSRTSQFGASGINSIAYGNGVWVAVGVAGKISSSTDGINWTARTSNMSTNELNHVIYANSIWVVVGGGGGATNTGGVCYSTDGTTWTRKSMTPNIGTIYFMSAWNGTNWIIVGQSTGTFNYLYATDPSGTWTGAIDSVGGDAVIIFWDGTRSIFCSDTLVRYSTTTTLASAVTYRRLTINTSGRAERRFWKYYNNLLYRFSLVMQTIITESSASPSTSAPILLPTTNIDAGNTISIGMSTSFVGSAGIILSDTSGSLYTSF
jgi:hypothetical protein